MSWVSYWIIGNSEAINKKKLKRIAGIILTIALCVVGFLIGMMVGSLIK